MSSTKKTVGVIFGSRSVEHDVSVVTAQQVMQALRPEKYEVVPIYITRDGRWLTGPGLRDLRTFQADNVAELMGIQEIIISPSTAHHGAITPPVSGFPGCTRLARRGRHAARVDGTRRSALRGRGRDGVSADAG
jgi:D-alanine-D-alanine ligase-like ATP-grasp enzyme